MKVFFVKFGFNTATHSGDGFLGTLWKLVYL